MVINKLDYDKIEGRITKFKKGVPKRDGSGKGIRLNKGRGGCSLEEQSKRRRPRW